MFAAGLRFWRGVAATWYLQRLAERGASGPRRGIAPEQATTSRSHVAIRVVDADLSFFSKPRESAGGAQVIVKAGALAVQHTSW